MIKYSSRLLNVKDELTQKPLQKMHPTSQNYLFYMLHGLRVVIQVGKRLSLCFTCSTKPLRHQIACNICRLNVMLSVSDNQAGMPQVYSVFKSSNHQMYYTAFVHTETVILKSSKNNTFFINLQSASIAELNKLKSGNDTSIWPVPLEIKT